jgi:hypothetical protein
MTSVTGPSHTLKVSQHKKVEPEKSSSTFNVGVSFTLIYLLKLFRLSRLARVRRS